MPTDTYQTKLTVNGRNPGDNTLEVYRTAGTDCTEIAATYRNQNFWLPTGKNWFTRKWISGEDQDDGFKQCVCVGAGYATQTGCSSIRIPQNWIIDSDGVVGDVSYAFSTVGFAVNRSPVGLGQFNTTIDGTLFVESWHKGDGTVVGSNICNRDSIAFCHSWYAQLASGPVAPTCEILLFRDGLTFRLECNIGFWTYVSGTSPLLMGAFYDEYTASSVADAESWLNSEHVFENSCAEWLCAGNGVPGSVTGCISSTLTSISNVRIVPT